MDLHKISKLKGNSSKAKRVGRGYGSGKGGHTSGRGNKGQNARKGRGRPMGFEGGQVPYYKKVPQLGGFNNPTSRKYHTVYLSDLDNIKTGTRVTPEFLVESGLITSVPKHGVKILANGKISTKLTISGFSMSSQAREKLEKAGCTVEA
jgi:large subunit ribosomal protein L15